MTSRWKVECVKCGKKETFGDEKDISHARWKVLAWVVPSGEPRCVCDKCEYDHSPEKKLK